MGFTVSLPVEQCLNIQRLLDMDDSDSANHIRRVIDAHLNPRLSELVNPYSYVGCVGQTTSGSWFIYLGFDTDPDAADAPHRVLPLHEPRIAHMAASVDATLRLEYGQLWDPIRLVPFHAGSEN